MRYAIIALAFLAGCTGDTLTPPDEPQAEPGPEGTELQFDPALLDNPTSELGTDRLRPIAKTIDWPAISTNEGTTYLEDAVVVDRVLRDDAQNRYGVRLRLKNTTKKVVAISWIIRFYTRQGGRVAGYTGLIGEQERWQGAVIEPFETVVVHDSALISGAEGFKLFVKGQADKAGPGDPDDGSPAAKAQRAQKRAGMGSGVRQ